MGLSSQYNLAEVQDYMECATNIRHFIENKIKTWVRKGGTDLGFEKLKMNNNQRVMLSDLVNFNRTCFMKFRQAGASTLVCAYISHQVSFNQNLKVVVASDTLKQAGEIINKIKEFTSNLPKVMRPEIVKNSQTKIIFDNGCEILAQGIGKIGSRGYSADIVFFEEFMWAKHFEEFYGSILPCVNPNCKFIGVSTPGKHIEKLKIWEENSQVRFLHWFNDERFDKDLYWERTLGDKLEIYQPLGIEGDYESSRENRFHLIQDGAIPKSPWLEAQSTFYGGFDDPTFRQHMMMDYYKDVRSYPY